jgi:hypothetical protein
MVVRVDRELFDPVAVYTAASGVTFTEDGTRPPPWQPRPFTTKTEYQMSEALRLMSVPADVIRQQVPPTQLRKPPPMFGYDETPLTIGEVLDADRWTPEIRSWVSGTARKPRRQDAIEDMWSGTLRGFNASPNMAG